MTSDWLLVKPKEVHSCLTRDGVRLDADVYCPEGDGPWPVLLMRQPYGREIASTVVYAHPTWYAAQGYIVVIQDVRGRGTSGGDFKLFAHEVNDGYDTVQWAAQLPNSNGQVGMYGFSYQGMTQLYAAQAKPSALKVLAPAMVGYDLYQDWAYENGALRLQAGLGWAIQLAAETARLRGDDLAFNALRSASRNLPLNGAVTAEPDVLRQYAADSFWHDWVAHPQDDDYWQGLKPNLADVDLPMLHVGGWFDPYLTGDIRLFKEMVRGSAHLQHLWVGPWTHLPWSRKVGEMDFGLGALNPIDKLQVQWFDYCLKGKGRLDHGLTEHGPVHLFEMGSNCWRCFDAWPSGGKVRQYQLQSTGLAGMREDDGQLVLSEVAVLPDVAIGDVLVHDPWRPVPALGGHGSWPGGSCDRTALDGRSDILTYTTSRLEGDLAVAGEVTVALTVETAAASYDICAVLSVVQPDGRVFNLTQGYRRVAEPGDVPVTVPLQPTCFRLRAGQALRLSLSGACFPAYPVNSGTAAEINHGVPTMEHQVITLAIHQGPETVLVLPLG
ncbi:CocE/NonD family hydrolase [Leptothoe kymatousa]|uniref:CocE/NonD family hydrolase n=1 Tax=Leptothoe kymatousa TAU-MAC 1615 TaxID=2364775 RepID=A0ABS5XYW8_9CYAN|nr:CocE/NonD family hydrolase [Leptothoe kymatousa]MBT9310800.1 CocE/NonD family hydrolase [Leptothoe kymatousa TAU-MAC 1615]